MQGAKRTFKGKVVLLGAPEVGKTSLIRRYVINAFDEHYIQTLGTVITKRTEVFPLEGGGGLQTDLTIWDIMGQQNVLAILKDVYFSDLQGALAVFDVTRPETLQALKDWFLAARWYNPKAALLVLGNKVDLADQRRVTDEEAKEFCNVLGLPYYPASAKTGLNVETAFRHLAGLILAKGGVHIAPVQ